MKKLIYVGTEKDYDERDLEMAAFGFPGCMNVGVYVDPETGDVYHENIWGDLALVEFPWKAVVVYEGSSAHTPQFQELSLSEKNSSNAEEFLSYFY